MKKIIPLSFTCIFLPKASGRQANIFPIRGYVGIGTSSPSSELEIDAENPSIKFILTNSTPSSAIRGVNSTWLFGHGGRSGQENLLVDTRYGTGNRTVIFASGGYQGMKILANGNVGVGNPLFQWRFIVNGTITAKQLKVTQTG